MSDQLVRLIVGAGLLLHGLGHGGALGALVWIDRVGGNTGAWTAARSWVLPAIAPSTAMVLASAFWVASLVGFVAAALSYFGILLPPGAWRQLAVAFAVVSTGGIVAFAGTWPTFNTVAALAVNVAVIVGVLVLRWQPESIVGQ